MRRVVWSSCSGEPVKVVPCWREHPDRVGVFKLQTNPLGVVPGAREELPEALLPIPMGELRTIQKHDAGRPAFINSALGAGALPAQNRLATHIPLEQGRDVPESKNVWIHHYGPSLVAHELGRHKAKRRKGLQILVQPHPLHAIAEIGLALVLSEDG